MKGYITLSFLPVKSNFNLVSRLFKYRNMSTSKLLNENVGPDFEKYYYHDLNTFSVNESNSPSCTGSNFLNKDKEYSSSTDLEKKSLISKKDEDACGSIFTIPIAECIKSPTICNALSKPPFNINKFTTFQKEIWEKLLSAVENSDHVIIKSGTGTGKTLVSLLFIISMFISKHRDIKRRNENYLKPYWLAIVPTSQLVSQLEIWSEFLIPSPHIATFKKWCLIGTPKVLLQSMIEEIWTPKYLTGIYMDEADAILQPASRYKPVKDNKRLSPCTSLLSSIIDLNFDTRVGAPPLPQLIISSATLNCLTRAHLFKIGYFKNDFKKQLFSLEAPTASIPSFIDNEENNMTKLVDQYGLSPISHSKTLVRHLVYVTTLEDEESGPSMDMSMDSKASLIASMLLENKYQKSTLVLFLPKQVSRSNFLEVLKSEYSDNSLVNSPPPPLNICYFTDKIIRDPTATLLVVGSDEDCRGIHLPDLKAVFIVGPIASYNSYIHMSGRVGRYSYNYSNTSNLGQHQQDVISFLSKEDLATFQRYINTVKFEPNKQPVKLCRWSSEA